MIRKSDLADFDPKSVTSKGMAWLILDTESCAGNDLIDVVSDIHVKVSHAKWIDMISS
jgi:hypothetical protein